MGCQTSQKRPLPEEWLRACHGRSTPAKFHGWNALEGVNGEKRLEPDFGYGHDDVITLVSTVGNIGGLVFIDTIRAG